MFKLCTRPTFFGLPAILLAIAVMTFTPINAKAENSCPDLFAGLELSGFPKGISPFSFKFLDVLPVVGGHYRVQLEGDPTIHYLLYKGIKWDHEDGAYLDFVDLTTKRRLRIERSKLADWRSLNSAEDSLIKRLFIKLIEYSVETHALVKLMFKPYKILASNEPGVFVSGPFSGEKSIAQKIADNLQIFDQRIMNIGFKRPKITRVLIGSKPWLPDLIGPFSLSKPILNIWSGQGLTPVIGMNSFFYNSKVIQEKSILFHERMHSVLQQTYSAKAFINQNQALQEALADFGSAHITGSPRVGTLYKFNSFERNIETQRAQFGTNSQYLTQPLDVQKNAYHENSLLMSHIFWELRSTLGPAKMDSRLKKVLDNINSYRDSYESLIEIEKRPLTDEQQIFAYDLEYLLAVILKTSETWSEFHQTEQLIKTLAQKANYTLPRIQWVAGNLKHSSTDFTYSNTQDIGQSIYANARGAIGLVVEASILYLASWAL